VVAHPSGRPGHQDHVALLCQPRPRV